jgi:hypothetical protein
MGTRGDFSGRGIEPDGTRGSGGMDGADEDELEATESVAIGGGRGAKSSADAVNGGGKVAVSKSGAEEEDWSESADGLRECVGVNVDSIAMSSSARGDGSLTPEYVAIIFSSSLLSASR